MRVSLCDDITLNGFEVGYLKGSTVVRIRTTEDVSELCSVLQNPQCATILWCDGLRAASKRHAHPDSGDNSEDELPRSKKARGKSNTERVKEVQG